MILFTPHVLNFFKESLPKLSGNYLEIGVYNGVSIRTLALTYPDKLIIGVDPFIEDGCTTHNSGVAFNQALNTQKSNTIANIADIKNIKLFEMPSTEFLSNHSESFEELNVSAVFVDGSHHYHDVVNDYKLAMDLLGKKEGLVCFDDLHVSDVSRAVAEFKVNYADRIVNEIVLGVSVLAFQIKEL